MGLQGVVSPAKLQANASSALVYVAQVLAGSDAWDTLLFGILPLGAAGFLCWIIFRSLQPLQRRSSGR
jgi:hypothetical protein